MFRHEAMDAFMDWLRGQQHKIHWPKVALQLISNATGYGLFARENIRLGETVIQVQAAGFGVENPVLCPRNSWYWVEKSNFHYMNKGRKINKPQRVTVEDFQDKLGG